MIYSLQYLRAIAAIMVVIFHAGELRDISGHASTMPTFALASGVDIFFVLSGYLMAHLSSGEKSGLRFFSRRILRVGPIYWLITFAIGIAAILRPGLSNANIDWATIGASLAFIPTYFGSDTLRTTVVPVGWSLVYEVYFYSLFTIAIFLGHGARFVLLILLSVFVAGQFISGNFYLDIYSNPIALEFGLGILVSKAPAPTRKIAIPGAALAFSTLLLGAYFDGRNLDWRLISCGIPSALVVYFSAAIRLPKMGLPDLLGTASYSIYLVHMYGLRYIAAAAGIQNLFLMSAIGVALGIATYWLIERKLNEVTTRWQKSTRKVIGVAH